MTSGVASGLKEEWDEALIHVASQILPGVNFSDSQEIPPLLEKVSFARVDRSRLRDARIWIFSGPTGVGKGFVCDVLRIRLKMTKIPNIFTRPRRPGESATEFVYMTEEKFREARDRGLFLQINQRHGYWHGLLRSRVDDALSSEGRYFMDKSVPSTVDLITKLSRAQLFLVYILPPSFEELAQRIIGRDLSMRNSGQAPHSVYENVRERVATSTREFREGGHIYDLFVVNDKIDRVIAQIVNLVSSVQA